MSRDITKFDYLTYEWRKNSIVVHGWDYYPRYSVLAGQQRKSFLDSFDTAEEAQDAYPTAEPSHPMMQPVNTFGHLSDDGDY